MPTRTIRKPAKGQAVGVVKIVPGLASREEQLAAGRALRESTPRERHAIWNPPVKRRDPVDVLQESSRGRVAELVPIRYGRMLRSPFTSGKSVYKNHGERVVMGQRRMQSSSDIFLGWTRGRLGYDFFGRQLRDMKMSFPVEGASAVQHLRYGEVCGLTLARAHAKCGDAALISGYLGKSDVFDKAIGRFAVAYADQTEKDHAALVAAVKVGRVEALVEEDL